MPVCAKTQPTPPHHQDPSLQRSVALRKPLPLGAVVECRPARLPAGIEHEKYDILTLISKLEMLGFEPCASDHFLAVPQLELPALPPCRCDSYSDERIKTPEDIEEAKKKRWTMCARATLDYDGSRATHHAELTCYAPHAEYPTVGHDDGGGLTFDGCRSDMLACEEGYGLI